MAQQDCGSVRLPALISTDMTEQHEKQSAANSATTAASPAIGIVVDTVESEGAVSAAAAKPPADLSQVQPKIVGECPKLGVAADASHCHENVDLEAAAVQKEEVATSSGEYIQSFVLGGLDGILSTFALVAGLGGAHTNVVTLLAVTLAKVIADAFSMGFGVYSSTSAELEHARQLKARELREVENNESSGVQGMCEIYMQKGCSKQDASTIMTTMVKYRGLFVDHRMVMEHGVLPPGEEGMWEPLKQGAVCFISFVCFGLVPVVGFVFQYLLFKDDADMTKTLLIAYAFTAFTLFVMGIIKAKLTGQGNSLLSGAVMVVNGTIAGGMAFVIGEILTTAFEQATWATGFEAIGTTPA
eukprot:CAMPEP_0115303000 /NCGR_PEP_ID=MMETSP0270-20121206/70682_1 /TAXON_ID=71861 /ORGANISM="Scrippsiella trochoidea, Strain CCMP3099" /LENGTH=356 /DNA_ID=CAMNT_0002720963 /DNA_START=41 /DNA_END=1112 /DNA_ORIENTATION=-